VRDSLRFDEAWERPERKLEESYRPPRGSFKEHAERYLRQRVALVTPDAIETLVLGAIDAKREDILARERRRHRDGRFVSGGGKGGRDALRGSAIPSSIGAPS
jgi:hypothetical protein